MPPAAAGRAGGKRAQVAGDRVRRALGAGGRERGLRDRGAVRVGVRRDGARGAGHRGADADGVRRPGAPHHALLPAEPGGGRGPRLRQRLECHAHRAGTGARRRVGAHGRGSRDAGALRFHSAGNRFGRGDGRKAQGGSARARGSDPCPHRAHRCPQGRRHRAGGGARAGLRRDRRGRHLHHGAEDARRVRCDTRGGQAADHLRHYAVDQARRPRGARRAPAAAGAPAGRRGGEGAARHLCSPVQRRGARRLAREDRLAGGDGAGLERAALRGVAPPVPVRMSLRARNAWQGLALATLLSTLAQDACAQATAGPAAAYPARPVRVTVGFAPGGGVDITARALAQKLSETLGKPFVVENRGGAGGTAAYAVVAKAAPDGYNLLAISGSYAMSAALYQSLPYDPVRDFAPITLIGAAPFSICVHPSLPVRTVADLIALARAKPGALNFASGGMGSSGHLTGELFKSMARIQMTYIPYKGGELALVDLIAGHVHIVFTNLLTALPHIRSGRARGLAVTSPRRHYAVPEIPTVAESGL